jgi:hypothetical protein
MDAIREQANKPLVVGIVAFVVGVIIGLVVLGWWLWPVQWTDAGPADLRIEYQEIYLRDAIDSYTLHQDAAVAQQRIQEVGENANEVLAEIQADPQTQDPGSIQAFVLFAGSQPEAGVTTPATPPAGVTTPAAGTAGVATPKPAAGSTSVAKKLLPWMCLITLLLAGALVVVFLLRNRGFSFKMPQVRKEAPKQPQYVEYAVSGEEPPLSQFMTTYQIGNDLYDDSFSIDSPAGEFLGECGVGISETIGVGDPKRVTAFEVWLFDKNDIQTVTKVLMSQHAFEDEATRLGLAAKGEPVLAEPGHEMVLETASLRLVARVVDMSYGSSSLPPDSFFDRMTLQLSAWPKA